MTTKRIRNAKNVHGGIEILDDGSVQVTDKVDRTKKMKFDLASLPTGTVRTVGVSAADGVAATTQNVQDAAADKASYCMKTALTARVEVATSTQLNSPGDFTYIAQFKCDGVTASDQVVIDRAPGGVVNVAAYVRPTTGKMKFVVGSGTNSVESPMSVADGRWHTLALTRSVSACGCYLDGTNLGLALSSSDNLTNTQPISLGGYNSGSLNLNGSIGRCLFFNYAVPEEKIQRYSAGAKLDWEDIGGSMAPKDTWINHVSQMMETFSWNTTTKVLTIGNASGSGIAHITDALPAVGKRVRVKFTVSSFGGLPGATFRIGLVDAGGNPVSGNSIIISGNGTYETVMTITTNAVRFEVRTDAPAISAVLTFTGSNGESGLHQLGAILDLEPENITDQTWFDASPNGLHGVVTGAIATNARSSIPSYSAQNYIINGAMDFWQRGTTISNGPGGASYTPADRWRGGSSGATTTYAQSTDVPSSLYSYSLEGSDGSNSYSWVAQRIESENSRLLVGKTVTLRFWIKTTSPDVRLYLGYAGSKDVFSGGAEIENTSVSSQITSGAWSLVTYRFNTVIPTQGANGLELIIYYNYASGAAQSAKITGFQLNEGPVAAPFQRAGGTIGGELALCQRYFQIILSPNKDFCIPVQATLTTASSSCEANCELKQEMRAPPTPWQSSLAAGNRGRIVYNTSSSVPVNAWSFYGAGTDKHRVSVSLTFASSVTLGNTSTVSFDTLGCTYSLGADAEL